MSTSQRLLAHLVAAGLALSWALLVSVTSYLTTGAQFVTPLAIIVLVHVGWMWAHHETEPGYATVALGRALATAVAIVAGAAILAGWAPTPAVAAGANIFLTVAAFLAAGLYCLVILAVVVGLPALVIFLLVRGIRAVARELSDRSEPPRGPGQSRLHDGSIIAVTLLALAGGSLEGMAPWLTVPPGDRAAAVVLVAASPERIWKEVGRATSPRFPLPMLLQGMPRPVAVLVDEGAGLGARRVVRFVGREGTGDLVLHVTRRTGDEVVFEVQSDTTPIAAWVRHRALIFRVEPAAVGSRLTVSLDYDRRLAPAWFFGPFTRLAADLAVDVLARDTAERSLSP